MISLKLLLICRFPLPFFPIVSYLNKPGHLFDGIFTSWDKGKKLAFVYHFKMMSVCYLHPSECSWYSFWCLDCLWQTLSFPSCSWTHWHSSSCFESFCPFALVWWAVLGSSCVSAPGINSFTKESWWRNQFFWVLWLRIHRFSEAYPRACQQWITCIIVHPSVL